MKLGTGKIALLVVLVAVLLFFYLPLFWMVVSSFQVRAPGTDTYHFSLQWYASVFGKRDVVETVSNTLFVGVVASLVSTILGTISALAIYKYRSSLLQGVHSGLVYIPVVMPEILMGFSLLICFSAVGMQLGRMTVTLAHIAFCTSYVVIVIGSSLDGFDFTLVEASRDLGASYFQTFRRVLLPLMRPAICAGALLAFTLSLDDFIVTFFVSGPGSETLPVYIYSSQKHGNMNELYALSSVLLMVTVAVVTISVLFSGSKVIESCE